MLTHLNTISIERKPSKQVIHLLEENVIGTPGKSMVYRHCNVRTKLAEVEDPYFANLSIRNKLYGTICFSKRTVYNLGEPHPAFYLRYFTFREKIRSDPSAQTGKASGRIREDVFRLLEGHGLGNEEDLILYAYVDPGNVRSRRLIDEFGFRTIGNFDVITFSRLFPKWNIGVEKVRRSRQSKVLETVKRSYRNEQLVTLNNLFSRGDYFVYKHEGKMTCGVQAIPDHWQILEMPAIWGMFLMKILPRVPVLNRLFNPDFRFVFMESPFCLDGCEKHLGILFESVLNYYQLNSGILCLDKRSGLYSKIRKNYLGLTNTFQGERQVEIVVKTSRPDLVKEDVPVSVSGFDVL